MEMSKDTKKATNETNTKQLINTPKNTHISISICFYPTVGF